MKGVPCLRFGGVSGGVVLTAMLGPSCTVVRRFEETADVDDQVRALKSDLDEEEAAGAEQWATLEAETPPIQRPTNFLWLRPWFLLATGVAGGAAVGGLLYPLWPIVCWGTEGTSPVCSNVTASTEAAEATGGTSSLFSYTTAASETNAGAPAFVPTEGYDCQVVSPSDVFTRCKPHGLISAFDLATMRLPSEFCKKVYKADKMTEPMRKATMDGWKELNWSRCASNGGRILCTDDNGENLQGYYFGVPFEFDLHTVWEAIVYNQKPTQCSYQCNSNDEERHLKFIRFGIAGGKWAGIDVDGASESKLYQLGRQASKLTSSSDGYSEEICFEGRVPFECTINKPTDKISKCHDQLIGLRCINFGEISKFHTHMSGLFEHYNSLLAGECLGSYIGRYSCLVFENKEYAKNKLTALWKDDLL